ncbi:MAG: hypothetical protein H7X92_14710 [Chitinophagales bacterium]|nr:hypothetical protein [Hyphomicrobiales bacterium]
MNETFENFVLPKFSFRPLRPEEKDPADGMNIYIRSDNPSIYVQSLGGNRPLYGKQFALFWGERCFVFQVLEDIDDKANPKLWTITWTIVDAPVPAPRGDQRKSDNFRNTREFELASHMMANALCVYNAQPTHSDHRTFQKVVKDVVTGPVIRRKIKENVYG